MSRSSPLWKDLLVSLLIIAVVSSLLLPCIPGAGGECLSYDAVHAYSWEIEKEVVSNWHSSLFIYECIALKRIVCILLGRIICGIDVLRIVWGCLTLVMLISMIVLGRRLAQQSWVWLLAFPYCVYLGLNSTLSHLYPVGLDYYFMCLLWPMLAALVEYCNSETKRKRLAWLVVVLIVLLHLVSYRKNAALLVPVLMACLLYGAERFRMLSWSKKFVAWGISVVMVLFVAFSGVDVILPVKKGHPLIPMMESDVRIASILRGEQDEFRKQGCISITGEKAERSITAFWYGKTKCEWNALKNIYIGEWRTHPETMMAAAIIQRVQFYCGGHSFQFLKQAVESRYPIVKHNPKAWEICVPQVHDLPSWRLLWICMAPLHALLVYALWSKKRLSSTVCIICVGAAVMAVLYACSYMIVVPTPDARYLAPSYMLALVAASVLVGALVEEFVRICAKKEDSLRSML